MEENAEITTQYTDPIAEIASRLKREADQGLKPKPEVVPLRRLLSWFGYERRGRFAVTLIRRKLERFGLHTTPDFEYCYIESSISISSLHPGDAESTQEMDDPTVRVGILEAANREPTSVTPHEDLNVATTKMQINDFSQLPVMEGKRSLKGIISWESIGLRIAMGKNCRLVKDCMDVAEEIGIDAPLLDAAEGIAKNGYVLVKGTNGAITGIVTASDLASQFLDLAGPFLAIAEIERHLRMMIRGKFTDEEVRDALGDVSDDPGAVGPDDLTFGNYRRLLENPQHWSRLELNVAREVFIERLESVRLIRNDIMHFDPDGPAPGAKKTLSDFAKFFRDLARMRLP